VTAAASGERGGTAAGVVSPRALVLPLALAQFVASYAGTNMNVAISTIADDIGTTVHGMQTTITLFTLTMASLMIPGSKLSDIWGRKRCFLLGLSIYGAGALFASFSWSLTPMVIGYSLMEGIGSALMIPPIYILVTVTFADAKSRARYFGVVSGAAGLGSAAGPLIGGLVTSAISWRASFILQVLIVATIIALAAPKKYVEPTETGPRFDLMGAILSAAGLFFIVFGILQTSTHGWFRSIWPVWVLMAIGVAFLVWFFAHIRSYERKQRPPLVPIHIFKNRTANLGLGTQFIQWLILQGAFFVISVYLQQKGGYNAIQTGLMLLPATIGILLSSAAAQRMAQRRAQRGLVSFGFLCVAVGMVLLLAFGRSISVIGMAPGLFLIGAGVGIMLTASVNVVQSAFPEQDQGEISGVSRSVSNLGSSVGVALVGSVVASVTDIGGRPILAAFIVLMVITLIGFAIAMRIPKIKPVRT
jgi:MFS family permease